MNSSQEGGALSSYVMPNSLGRKTYIIPATLPPEPDLLGKYNPVYIAELLAWRISLHLNSSIRETFDKTDFDKYKKSSK